MPITATRLRRTRAAGLTLIELVIALAIVGVLASVALPSYQRFMQQRENDQAKADIKTIEADIARFEIINGRLPDSLAEVGLQNMLDPWGNPYEYLKLRDADKKSKGKVRKDKSLHPLNSDYDLYSKGKDGKSASPLTAAISHDDIIRANDGRYIGLGADF